MQIQSKYDIIIVGGGVYGLSIAYYLSKNPQLKIALLEQYSIGHNKGSSHSTTRITRSVYQKELYRDLNIQCLKHNWPQLEKVLGQKIVYQNDFIYYDDNEQTYKNFKKVAMESPQKGIKICQSQKQFQDVMKGRKYPQINSKYPAIVDPNAGIIYASIYIKSLQQHLTTQCPQVSLIQHCLVKSISQNQNQINISTQSQILRCNKVVLACGKWIKEMAPQLKDMFFVVKQFAAFLEMEQPKNYEVGKFPAFVYHQKDGSNFYCVPGDTTEKLGIKLAQHRGIEYQHIQYTPEQAYEDLRKKSLQYFGEDFVRVRQIIECVYTITKTDDFVIDWVGQSQKILVCSSCSGHGFKFSPIISEIVRSLLTSENKQNLQNLPQKTKQIYSKWQHMFRIAYQLGVNLV